MIAGNAVISNAGLVSHLNSYARSRLRIGLELLPEAHKNTFRLMYGRDNGNRSIEAATEMPLNNIIEAMPLSALDWALSQTELSLKKLGLKMPDAKWTPESATLAAQAAGFAGTTWVIGPEELALLLNRVQPKEPNPDKE